MTEGGWFGRPGPVFRPLVFTVDLRCTTGKGSLSSLSNSSADVGVSGVG